LEVIKDPQAQIHDTISKSPSLMETTKADALPFTALGFDLLAEKVSFDGKYTLSDVASLKYRLSCGCPL
jgi:hypothetical protein